MLTLLNAENFANLEKQWAAQCHKYGEDFSDYASPSIDHARDIASQAPSDSYGVYCMKDDQTGEEVCLMHGNIARLPKTTGRTLRIVWVLLAPRFDFEDVPSDAFARITANLIIDSISQAKEAAAEHLKLHLGNTVDRTYFAAVAATLTKTKTVAEATIRGNWLHITM